MKKSNQPIFFIARLSRYLVAFCIGCLAFATAIGQPTDHATVPNATDSKENKTTALSTNCCNLLFIGPSTILEDSYKPFNTYGPTVVFTHPLAGKLGITGNAGIYFGSGNNVDYTKFQLLGGLSLLPNDNRISFSPHLLAGVSSVNSKYKLETMSFSNNNTGLTVAAVRTVL